MKKIRNDSKRIFLVTLVITIGLYMFHFLLIPFLYKNFIVFKNLDDVSGFVMIISTIIVVAAEMILVSEKIRYWLVSDVIYVILVYIYHEKGLYGIGMVGINLDGATSGYRREAVPFGVAIITGFVIISEILSWFIVKVYKYIQNYNKNNDSK